MSLCDFRESSGTAVNARILATDISEEVLKKAEKGIYPKKEKELLPVSWQEKYCVDVNASDFCKLSLCKFLFFSFGDNCIGHFGIRYFFHIHFSDFVFLL